MADNASSMTFLPPCKARCFSQADLIVTNPTESVNTARTFYAALAGGDATKGASHVSKVEGCYLSNHRSLGNSSDDELMLLSEFITRLMAERYNKGWPFTMSGCGVYAW